MRTWTNERRGYSGLGKDNRDRQSYGTGTDDGHLDID
jgi:hypothetical protein